MNELEAKPGGMETAAAATAVDSSSPEEIARAAERFQDLFAKLRAEVARVIVGLDEVVEQTLIALVAGGHVLLEGAPGVGKTRLCRTIAGALDLDFGRIQFTPDLVPADVTGTTIVVEGDDGRKRFEFRPGPIFANVLLADEINRATPKTQSALLEAMAEGGVTAGGQTRAIAPPFCVVATQNPIELEGTFPLPEAQLDRFLFKVAVPAPGVADVVRILERTTTGAGPEATPVATGADVLELHRLARSVPAAPHVLRDAASLVVATTPPADGAGDRSDAGVGRWLRLGASPRAAQSMILGAKVRALAHGRPCASVEDVRALAAPALRHRLVLTFEAEAEGLTGDELVARLLRQVGEPGGER